MEDFTLVIHFLIYGALPYIVMAVLFVGSIGRFILAPYTWKSQSSQILDRHEIMWGANLFHIGVIFLFCGHCAGLFTPPEVLDAFGLTPPIHQMVEIFTGGFFAILALIGIGMLIARRLGNPRVRISSRSSDFLVLALILLVLALGVCCIINAYFTDRSGKDIVIFGEWVRGLFTFNPSAWTLMLDVPIWQKLHIFVGLLIFLVVPFTRLIHIWSGYLSPLYLIRPPQIMRINQKPMK